MSRNYVTSKLDPRAEWLRSLTSRIRSLRAEQCRQRSLANLLSANKLEAEIRALESEADKFR
jgi:hypothetical protein